MDISNIYIFNFKNDKVNFPEYYHRVYFFNNEIVSYSTYKNGEFCSQKSIKINDFIDSIINISETDIFSNFNQSFNQCLNLFNDYEKNIEFKSRIRVMENTYRILDSIDIEFMKTDLYKKYSSLFNLILGIKVKYFKDDNDDYYFNRFSAYYLHTREPFFTKISEDKVSKHLMSCENSTELIAIFMHYFNLKLSKVEKDEFHKFFIPKIKYSNIKVGDYYKIIDKFDIDERNKKWYLKNPLLVEDLLGICIVGYIDSENIYLYKLDYNDMGLPYNFYKKMSLKDFLKFNFIKLEDNYHKHITETLYKLGIYK